MTDMVRARLAAGREIGPEDFGDLTPVSVESVGFGPDGLLEVAFTDPVPVEVAAAVERRIVSATSTEERLRADAETYLSTRDPDLTAIRAQVRRLTEIVLGRTTT